jgi:arginyl-tRNA synthetase
VHLTRARLALLQMIRYALASGLNILGVRPVHEM